MLIKNISPIILYLGFVNQGVKLLPNQSTEAPDNVVENKTFKALQNQGKLSIIAFDPDHTRYAIRDETFGGGGGSANIFVETLAVTAPNTLTTTTNVPQINTALLFINGLGASTFTVSGNNITWIPSLYGLDATDDVVIQYSFS